jgi:hypothetical protein
MKAAEYLQQVAAAKPAKRRKYKNTVTYVAGSKFDSAKEARRYGELRILESAGKIADLRLQVPIDCRVNDVKICTYIADFQYRCLERNVSITEDVKSDATRKLPVYRLKKKLVMALHGIAIEEI